MTMEASDFFVGNFFGAGNGQFLPDNRYFDKKPADNNQFTIDDLLDFPKEDEVMTDAFFDDSFAGNSADSSTVTAVDSCNSSVSGGEPQFSDNISCRKFNDTQFSSSELCVPYDDLAELEWLSNFVEESFSSDDMQNLPFNTTTTSHKSLPDTSSTEEIATNKNSPIFNSDMAVPGKARSKRSRAVPCNWSSRILLLSSDNSGSENNVPNPTSSKKRENTVETPGRRCLHCASEKTPQWRTGPLGPKTLCNACGVRYKSGRLVPEYRPAASPTFVSARHSNSHRKVMELRRQKDLRVAQEQQFVGRTSIFGASNGDDYLIRRQSVPDFRHML